MRLRHTHYQGWLEISDQLVCMQLKQTPNREYIYTQKAAENVRPSTSQVITSVPPGAPTTGSLGPVSRTNEKHGREGKNGKPMGTNPKKDIGVTELIGKTTNVFVIEL